VRPRIAAALIASAAPRLALLIALSGCGDRDAGAPAAASGSAVAAPPATIDPTAAARRPTRRYYLARTAARCEFYAVDLDGVSPPTSTPCPLDLQVGERIRIAGRTCTRDAADPDRRVPVVCPDPLTNLERRDQAAKRQPAAPAP
jgi:hypothetical protein